MKRTVTGEEQRTFMLETPIPKLVTKLAIPAVLTQLIMLVYNTADTYFVSKIDNSASAAVGAVFAVMALIQAVGFGFAMGASSLCSRLLGKAEDEKAETYATSAFAGAVSAGGLLAIFGTIFLTPLLKLIGCSETMMPYAKPYAFWILLSAPISCATFVLNNALRSEGQAKLAMFGSVSGGILNMILDPLFIFTLDMGTGGAAIATAIGHLLSFLVLLIPYLSGRTVMKLSPKRISFRLKTYYDILSAGFPTVCRQGMASIATAALNQQAVIFGDAVVASISICGKCYMLVRNMVLGVGQGFQPVAGYNFGAGNYKRTKKSFLFASAVGSVVCLLFSAGLLLFAEPIITWFRDDPEVIEVGRRMLFYSAAVVPFMAFSTYVNQLYQCLGFRFIATLLACCRQGIFFLPLVWILPRFFEVDGVLMTQAGSDFLTFLVSVPFLILMFRKKLRSFDEACAC